LRTVVVTDTACAAADPHLKILRCAEGYGPSTATTGSHCAGKGEARTASAPAISTTCSGKASTRRCHTARAAAIAAKAPGPRSARTTCAGERATFSTACRQQNATRHRKSSGCTIPAGSDTGVRACSAGTDGIGKRLARLNGAAGVCGTTSAAAAREGIDAGRTAPAGTHQPRLKSSRDRGRDHPAAAVEMNHAQNAG